MRRQYSGIICLIIALLIALSGMCVEIPQADSFFACFDENPVNSCLIAPEGELSQYKLSSRETIGIQDIAFVARMFKRQTERNIFCQQAPILVSTTDCMRTSDLQRTIETVHAPATYYSVMLLHYIQMQDGQKSIHL